ncbi:wax ester/triacylglycerol synthase family O-acyltransferase [Mycolicibacterium duvalii]|uniref:Diacylglycerol O-acyltransferase n=1 Tax=Mycolicibacterium duvalii TaxID=39688 RepID=A0A7I7JWX0_9MYCO|nr:wax ester/triacylglycerol synthase family O-acyltransferase [Mycolicibacterium duvalii]MCV7367078.1 wax ester/triacylglycerol synthase family O-acyltransferase [Mycolicibacterium duvalii]PEG40375.1 wax ester/triacylglycerol synthase family O-acyltransferase [Mycolicibacterium duvalii]BBX15794.1 diacylglycerol O-acyltransferase [Mycolicibacterium duvalii]
MDHLTTLDAGFLEAEDSDPHISLAIGGVAVLDGPIPQFDRLTEVFAQRAARFPRLTQQLRLHPLDLAAPEWVPDNGFDITHHIRRAALPMPGDDDALHRLVADIMERRLDRDHPLWECWVIEGLGRRRWALLLRIHHCLVDGIAATHLLTALCDEAHHTDRRVVRVSEQSPPPGRPNPVTWLTGAINTVAGLGATAANAVRGVLDIAGGLLSPSASTLNGPMGAMRRYVSAEVPRADVERICAHFDVTVNDVALAAITDSYRSLLLGRGERLRRDSLRTLVPVSVRSDDAADRPDNRVSLMLPCLPVDESDPIRQLEAVHSRLNRVKTSGQRHAGSAVFAAAGLVPFPLSAWAVRAFTRLPQRGVVTLATNVPGPPEPLTVLGCRITKLLPIPPLALQLRTGIAILSYADRLAFGVLADYDAAPDVDVLARGIEGAVARLADLTTVPHRSTPLGTLALVP